MAEHSDRSLLSEQHLERSCFIVFSSREPYIEKVLDRVCDLLVNELGIRPIRLDEARQPGEILQTQLLETMRACNFGIVFLDGFRPNIIFELGLLIAFGIPRLIMLEQTSTVNLVSLFKDIGLKSKAPKLKIDVQKHLSDLSNIGISYYSASDDLEFRSLVRKDIKKLIARSARNDGTALEFRLVDKINASSTLSDKRFQSLLDEVGKTRAKLKESQAAHLTMHLSRALRHRKNPALALRLVATELKRTNSSALIAEHAYILLEMGQSADAFKEITGLYRRNPKDMFIVQAYCILAIENGVPRLALNALDGLSYEKLVLSDLIPIKAQALFLSGKRSEAVSLLLDLYERNRSLPALAQATMLVAYSVDALLSNDVAQKLERLIVVGSKKNEIKCKACIAEASLVLGIKDLISKLPKAYPVSDNGNEAEKINEEAFNLIRLTKYKQAKSILGSALKRFPKFAYLHATLGLYFLKAEKDLPKGIKKYDDAVRLAPDDGSLRRMRLYQIGNFYLETGHGGRAKDYFRKALRVPDTERSYFLVSELTSLLK